MYSASSLSGFSAGNLFGVLHWARVARRGYVSAEDARDAASSSFRDGDADFPKVLEVQAGAVILLEVQRGRRHRSEELAHVEQQTQRMVKSWYVHVGRPNLAYKERRLARELEGSARERRDLQGFRFPQQASSPQSLR